MEHHTKIIRFAIHSLLVMTVILIAMGISTLSSTAKESSVKEISRVTLTVDGFSQEVTLPYTLEGLEPRTEVSVWAEITPFWAESLFLETYSAPVTLYVDETEVYSYGHDDERSSFMLDPAGSRAIIVESSLYRGLDITLTYLFPATRDSLTINPIRMGSEGALLHQLVREMGLPIIVAFIQIVLGILMLVAARFILPFEPKGVALFWMGLFFILTGLWFFGESDLSSAIFFALTPEVLYFMTFMGSMLCPAALLYFAMALVDFQRERWMRLAARSFFIWFAIALVLQLAGLVQLTQSIHIFHLLVLCALTLLLWQLIYEATRNKQVMARRLLIPLAVVGLSGVLEMLNFLQDEPLPYCTLFQLGMIFFMVYSLVLTSYLIRDSLQIQGQKQAMEFEMKLMSFQVEEQKKHQERVVEQARSLQRQRHDMRHQLAVLRRYNQEGEAEKLADYLDELDGNTSAGQTTVYCDNIAVNAVVSHYATRGAEAGITLEIGITVPACTPQISDSNLTVIFGNLLENAIEACLGLPEGGGRITLRSGYRYGVLTVVMDNSYNGFCKQEEGRFYSHKRPGYGIGLHSIQTVAEEHQGFAQFEGDDQGVFHSNLYLTVGEELCPIEN